MSKHEDQLSALEKQIDDLEDVVAKMFGDGKKRERYRPGDIDKKKKASEDTDDEYSDLEDDNDEDDMDKQAEEAAVKKAAEEKVAAEKAAAEKAAVEKAAAEKAAADKAAADKLDKGADETVTIEGQTIKKSAVGAEAFAIFKAQSEKLEKAEKAISEERDLRKMAELKKRADDEYPNIPGSVEERAQMLKAIDVMDEPLKKSFIATLNSAQKLSKMAFETLGSDGGRDPVTAKAFEGKVAEIKKRDDCSHQEAMQKARTEFPEEFKAFQGAAN